MSTLVIAAHPDDEVLGCGGTIARLCEEGEDVTIAILGEGITSRDRDGSDHSTSLDDLEADAREAARILGVSDVRFFRLPDNRFDSMEILDLIRIIERVIADVGPQVVYTHHGGDLNVDHQRVFQATVTACRPMEDSRVRSLYAFEIPSSTDWAFGQFYPRFNPSYFVDVSGTLARKLDAMDVYRSEIRQPPHPRSRDVLMANATRWGSIIGFHAAEAFAVVFDRE